MLVKFFPALLRYFVWFTANLTANAQKRLKLAVLCIILIFPPYCIERECIYYINTIYST
jgi:hypothetical protein